MNGTKTLLSVNRAPLPVRLFCEVADRDRDVDQETLDQLAGLAVIPHVLPLIDGVQYEVAARDLRDEVTHCHIDWLRDEFSVWGSDAGPFLTGARFWFLDVERFSLLFRLEFLFRKLFVRYVSQFSLRVTNVNEADAS